MITPQKIARLGDKGLEITWPDAVHTLSSTVLRKHCPSATSRAERGDTSHDAPLTTPKPSALSIVSATIQEATGLVRIWQIGNYAIGIEWSDGHNSGIYSYKYLRELGEEFSTSPAEAS